MTMTDQPTLPDWSTDATTKRGKVKRSKKPRAAKTKVGTKVKVAATAAALATVAGFTGKMLLSDDSRIETVAEFNNAVTGLDAGEMTAELRDLLHGAIDGYAADAGKRLVDQDIQAVLDKEGYVKARELIVDQWMRAAVADAYPGKGDDVVRERKAFQVLTGWKPGMDERLGREAMRALADVEVAKRADSAYELTNSDRRPGDLSSVFEASLKTLNAVRGQLNPELVPLSAKDFHEDSVVLFTAAGRGRASTGRSL